MSPSRRKISKGVLPLSHGGSCSPDDRRSCIDNIASRSRFLALVNTNGRIFDDTFYTSRGLYASVLRVKGAVADAQRRNGSDPRLRIMAHAIRHERQGEIALMRGVHGGQAVSRYP